jgi:hypothetical protein
LLTAGRPARCRVTSSSCNMEGEAGFGAFIA